jgi:hypothetical protein
MSHMRPNKTVKPKAVKLPRYYEAVCALADANGWPRPNVEYPFHPERRWRLDFAWHGVAVEVNGGVFVQGRHTRGSGAVKDWEKLNEAQLLGWTVLQVTPKQVTDGTLERLLRRALDGKEAA